MNEIPYSVGDVVISTNNLYEGQRGTVKEIKEAMTNRRLKCMVEFRAEVYPTSKFPENLSLATCKNCNSDMVYHDRREEYICPFCDP